MTKHTTKWLTSGAALAAILSGASLAHADNYEYNYNEGVHEEEWYDPSDWFDDEQLGYDSYSVDYDNDMDADWGFWNDDELWEEDYDYDYSSSYDYGTHYTWNDNTNSWEAEYGYHQTNYSYDPGSYMIVYQTSYNNSDRSNNSAQNQNHARNDRNAQRGNFSQNQSWSSNDRTAQHNSKQNQQNKQLTQKMLQGEIQGFRHMGLKANNEQKRDYTITKVRLDNGKTLAINLGEKDRLDSLDLEKGDDVKVKGVLGKLNGEPIFITNTLMVEGRSFDVNRAFDRLNANERKNQRSSDSRSNDMARSDYDHQNERTSNYDSSEMTRNDDYDRQDQSFSNSRWSNDSNSNYERQSQWSSDVRSNEMSSTKNQSRVQGTVEAFRSTRIAGSNEDLTLAKLRLESGKAITVDLGDNATVRRLELSQGDRVRIQGDIKRIEGQRVLKADRIWIDGERVQGFSYNY